MKPSLFLAITILVPAFPTAPSVRAQDCDPQGHLDIALVLQNARIQTAVFNLNDPGNALLADIGTRVWGAQFQADPDDPYFTDDPGYGAVAGSGLPPGSQVGFNVLDDLKYWDGNGVVQFGPVPNGERLRIKLGGQNRCVGSGIGFQSGFYMATVDSTGAIHVHTSLFLLGPDGPSNICTVNPPISSPTPPTDGIYLLTLQLKDSNASIAASDPVYVVLGNFAPVNAALACAHCVALDYVGARLAHDRPPGDLNFDRKVDQDDLTKLISCATGAGVPWTDTCCQGADLDQDGDIDMDDFAILQRCYGRGGTGCP